MIVQPPQTNGTVAKEATDKLAELITRQLLFPVHMHLDILAINARDGEHELPLTLRAEELKADLTNVTPALDALVHRFNEIDT